MNKLTHASALCALLICGCGKKAPAPAPPDADAITVAFGFADNKYWNLYIQQQPCGLY